MAARDARLAIALLDLLSSSSSSSDEVLKNPRKIPKIKNFVQVVHNLTDKDGPRYFYVHAELPGGPGCPSSPSHEQVVKARIPSKNE
ncbi:uncharacterized protein LOC113004136 [Solenopsis invicta]|uniref:uncharacterized protein LOC113004136 n=1 Tax=Solenopsis invicta TaxID=13686 RepID=UPI00193D9511|nr:uncharacterized protein LOC113004136 [Solenopsis invicta]